MPILIVICGTSFSGKTTLAGRLAKRFQLPQIDVDDTKTQLYGDDISDAALSGHDWTRIYAESDRCIAEFLVAGQSVIDASRNFTRRERARARALCERHGGQLLIIFVATPVAITRQRWLANRQNPVRRDVTDDTFNAILSGWERPAADEQALILQPDDDVEAWIECHTARFLAVASRTSFQG
jgi:predicted kinase